MKLLKADRDRESWRMVTIGESPRHGHYEVSDYGRVRHVYLFKEPRILQPFIRKQRKSTHGSSYMVVKIGRKETHVSHLVWCAFIGEIPKGYCIIHRNGLIGENMLSNLACVEKRKLGEMYAGRAKRKKSVLHIDKSGNILAIYRTTREAADGYKYLNRQSILDRCNGRIKRGYWLPDGTSFTWDEEE